jgi:hypothetical protein
VDSDAANPKENKTRGVLWASLTMEGVSAAEAVEALVIWSPLWSPTMDTCYKGGERVLMCHNKDQKAQCMGCSPVSSFGRWKRLGGPGGRAAPRGIFLHKQGEGGEGMQEATSNQPESAFWWWHQWRLGITGIVEQRERESG